MSQPHEALVLLEMKPLRLEDLPGDGCLICGADLSHRRVTAIYCSKKCYDVHMVELEREVCAAVLASKSCRTCGGSLKHRGKLYATFCSKKCQNDHFNGITKAAAAEARAGRTCAWCSKAFDSPRSCRVFCSPRCQLSDYTARARARTAEARAGRACRYCGEAFDGTRSDQVFCSKLCGQSERKVARPSLIPTTLNLPAERSTISLPSWFGSRGRFGCLVVADHGPRRGMTHG